MIDSSSHSRDSPMEKQLSKEEFYDFAQNHYIFRAQEFTILSGTSYLIFENALFQYHYDPEDDMIYEFMRCSK